MNITTIPQSRFFGKLFTLSSLYVLIAFQNVSGEWIFAQKNSWTFEKDSSAKSNKKITRGVKVYLNGMNESGGITNTNFTKNDKLLVDSDLLTITRFNCTVPLEGQLVEVSRHNNKIDNQIRSFFISLKRGETMLIESFAQTKDNTEYALPPLLLKKNEKQ